MWISSCGEANVSHQVLEMTEKLPVQKISTLWCCVTRSQMRDACMMLINDGLHWLAFFDLQSRL